MAEDHIHAEVLNPDTCVPIIGSPFPAGQASAAASESSSIAVQEFTSETSLYTATPPGSELVSLSSESISLANWERGARACRG